MREFNPLGSRLAENSKDTFVLATVKLAMRGIIGAPLVLLGGPMVVFLWLWPPLRDTFEIGRNLLGGIYAVLAGLLRVVCKAVMLILTDSWFWIFAGLFVCMASLDGGVCNIDYNCCIRPESSLGPAKFGRWCIHYDYGFITLWKAALLTLLLGMGCGTNLREFRKVVDAARQANKEYDTARGN
jgi:hypothetical protein